MLLNSLSATEISWMKKFFQNIHWLFLNENHIAIMNWKTHLLTNTGKKAKSLPYI